MATTIKESVYELIRAKALGGKIPSGSRISEVSLAREFGVSRTPVREAIGQLIHEGLVEQVSNEGTFMKKPSRIELEDLYQMREWVECGVVAAAVEHIGPRQIARLEAICAESLAIAREARMMGEGRKSDAILERCAKADLAFHAMLIQVSGNRLAMKTMGENHILSRVWSAHPDIAPNLHVEAWVYRDHARILRFVRRGDAEGAVMAMKTHIRRGRKQALHWFDLAQRRQAAGLDPYAFWPDSVLETVRRREDQSGKDGNGLA